MIEWSVQNVFCDYASRGMVHQSPDSRLLEIRKAINIPGQDYLITISSNCVSKQIISHRLKVDKRAEHYNSFYSDLDEQPKAPLAQCKNALTKPKESVNTPITPSLHDMTLYANSRYGSIQSSYSDLSPPPRPFLLRIPYRRPLSLLL